MTDLPSTTAVTPPATPPVAEPHTTKDTPSNQTQGPTEPQTNTASACEQTEEEIASFFSSLDNADYIGARQLKDGSQRYFTLRIDKLMAKPPVVARERESLTSILRNTAHLYRVLGKNDVALIKEILTQENDSVESAMALFYRWSELAPKCEPSKTAIRLPLRGLYEYAGFFLNTLGGQSYLYRRDSRVRLLGKYYSILVLDRANDASLNRHGIDIRPSVDSLLDEMKNTSNLTGRDTYLARLILLRDKYLARYGAKNAATVSTQ
ncbi:hypothetical protein [Thiovibrio frasassiensis]|uniref:Uncharacterized protein n=1 Tax=Thiovibrio frasassiensis TaxID=2984131 RepID=A0A9X4MGS6_9BACT|nr:hypothetical protein [Thiovibrio frasassiensis]MDG4476337.1 hypothetical protein [Thiovibrio frasassiensis]